MEQLNKVELAGIVGKSTLSVVGERQVLNFSVVTERCYKDQNGGAIIETTWHQCTAWESEKIPNEVMSAVGRGSKVHLVGRLRNRTYTDQDNAVHHVCEVMVSSLELVNENLDVTM